MDSRIGGQEIKKDEKESEQERPREARQKGQSVCLSVEIGEFVERARA